MTAATAIPLPLLLAVMSTLIVVILALVLLLARTINTAREHEADLLRLLQSRDLTEYANATAHIKTADPKAQLKIVKEENKLALAAEKLQSRDRGADGSAVPGGVRV